MKQPFPELRTDRLRLRQIFRSDAPALFEIHSDVEWMRWYGVDALTELTQAVELTGLFAGWFHVGTGFRWGLERLRDQRLIGTCGLFRWNKSWRNCAIGYEIMRDCHGHGYMREALTAVLEYGFNVMHLHRIQAETHPDNQASIGLATRLGFQFEGVHREQAFWGGRYHDLNCYSLLERNWRAPQDAAAE